jgi:hypothetical protein
MSIALEARVTELENEVSRLKFALGVLLNAPLDAGFDNGMHEAMLKLRQLSEAHAGKANQKARNG